MCQLLLLLIKRTEGRNTENYLLEFKAAQIRLNKVREIKSREFKMIRREF